MTPTERELENFTVTPEMRSEALKYFKRNKSYLIQVAIEEEREAISHRDPPFQVGCVVLGIEPKYIGAHYGIYKGNNFTLKPGAKNKNLGEDKLCAERRALKIAKLRSKIVVAVITVSQELDTGDGNKSKKALHPCQECRLLFRELTKEGLLDENTIVCNINNKGNEVIAEEERILKELLDLYPEDVTV
jgi:cytidine deaminase